MGYLFSLFPFPVITLPHISRLSHHARATYRRIKTFTTLRQLFWSSAVKLGATDWGERRKLSYIVYGRTKKLQDSSAKLQDSSAKLQGSSAKPQDSSAKFQDSSAKLQGSSAKLQDSSAKFQDSSAKLQDSSAKFQDSSAKLGLSGKLSR